MINLNIWYNIYIYSLYIYDIYLSYHIICAKYMYELQENQKFNI